jgi:hypothetical protein
MKISITKLECQKLEQYKESKLNKPFIIVKYEFDYLGEVFDKAILNTITARGEKLANAVNDRAANDSTRKRSPERKLSNAIGGVLAEYCWKNFLNSISLEVLVKETPFNEASTQIDLVLIANKKTIEVRSSFPRNGINFAICSPTYEFDIIGPYKNNYKPGEPQKDFYLRTLYHVPSPLAFLDRYKTPGFVTYLTGGATWEMMSNDELAIEKNFIPEDDFGETEVASTFRVIPFSKALDCAEVFKLIRAVK